MLFICSVWEFFYWTDDGNFAGLRYDQYKAVFMEQPAHGLEVWMQPLVPPRAPKLFNLRSDPFERAEQEAGACGRFCRDGNQSGIPIRTSAWRNQNRLFRIVFK